jgi:DNA-binding transcriptional ArsR family regulator
VDDVAAAIADPVRRAILELLREQPLAARHIAERFPISRPAVSRHLRVLRECGLVRDMPAGRERRYHLDPAPFAELSDWLTAFWPAAAPAPQTSPTGAERWQRHLDALETEVHRARRDRRRAGSAPDQQEEAS